VFSSPFSQEQLVSLVS